ncbi:MAG: DUF5682 family protein [Verrucomicrobiota bacterium]
MPTPPAHDALRAQIRAAAEAFASETKPLAGILNGLVDDVERAAREPLEIFPVCHHSPSSAVHMVRRLRERAPKVIFMECCEDLRPLLDGLAECTLPVALQAFSSQTEGFPPDWSPLNLVCPLTEFSAEFQAIAFSLTNHDAVELVFVDRSADHFFQWKPRDEAKPEPSGEPPAPADEELAHPHGAALAVELGDSEPTLHEFTDILLRNARVAHYSEWWDQYVEEAVIGADYTHYREVFFLVGSLIRRLGRRDEDIAEDELRERFMWTRMKQHLAARNLPPEDALYICGSAHAASRVEEFGAGSPVLWDIPARTKTEWLYGLLPSSYAAIERQFAHPAGSASLAEDRWRRELRKARLTAFRLPKKGKEAGEIENGEEAEAEAESEKKPAKKSKAPAKPKSLPVSLPPERTGDLATFLSGPPPATEEDQDTLLAWCTGIVSSARRHGYLSSTADSIAVYQTSVLLANLRNRRHPTPWDFRDAAVTCLEKDSVPKRRDIGRLCDLLLGGDRIGRIGYDSMPPLARDVYDRLKVLPVQLEARNIQRALLDFTKHPEWLPASELLWKLRCLLPAEVVRPIMGQRELGAAPPRQESWDLAIGRYQGAIIQLGYEGVTVEFVLEQRLHRKAFGMEARTVDALAAAEESILFLKNARLTAELGARARALLISEPDVRDAAKIYARIARLIHYYRSFTALPEWCAEFVTTGYSHYCTLLPNAFNDRGAKPAEVAAMLQFILTLESLALSLGCERSELVIAIRQAGLTATDPVKLALLWSVECVLQLRAMASLRAQFDRVLDNPVALTTLPSWLNGFLLSLSFTPVMSGFTVELMSKAFAWLPDSILMPWLPSLLMSLKEHANTTGALATLLKEAGAIFPRSLPALEAWTPPWDRHQAASASPKSVAGAAGTAAASPGSAAAAASPGSAPVRQLLRLHPASANALAALLGTGESWSGTSPDPAESALSDESGAVTGFHPAAALLAAWPAASIALAKLAGSR